MIFLPADRYFSFRTWIKPSDKIYQIPTLIQSGGQDGMQSLDHDLQRLVQQGRVNRAEASKFADNSEIFSKGVF